MRVYQCMALSYFALSSCLYRATVWWLAQLDEWLALNTQWSIMAKNHCVTQVSMCDTKITVSHKEPRRTTLLHREPWRHTKSRGGTVLLCKEPHRAADSNYIIQRATGLHKESQWNREQLCRTESHGMSNHHSGTLELCHAESHCVTQEPCVAHREQLYCTDSHGVAQRARVWNRQPLCGTVSHGATRFVCWTTNPDIDVDPGQDGK